MKLRSVIALLALMAGLAAGAETLPREGLVLDLDAERGVTLEDGDRVAAWTNQVAASPAREFVKRDEGRKEHGSGRPTLRPAVKELNGHDAIIFRQQELVNMDEDAFDSLTMGKSHTWFAVMAVHEQRVGLKDVNSFFGNLRNGGNYEGLWGNVTDDNTLWIGGRNGITFGRFDDNNPQILGPKLERERFYIVASRMEAGTERVKIELFVNDPKVAATGQFPVNAKANASRMVIGQERDAIQHPGQESFDGEIARFLIYDRPLTDAELSVTLVFLRERYGISHSATSEP